MIDLSSFVETLNGKAVAVFGLARSGLSTIQALKAVGAEVYAWDDREEARNEALELGAKIRTMENVLSKCAVLVLAPGVPLHFPEPHPVVKAAREADVEILCDVELLYRCREGRKIVGITGTNGKSTTTAILHNVLNVCGVDNQMGGNIGIPVLDLDMPKDKNGVFVVELSSYQLDLCPTLALDIAVLINISADHIDRHGSMEGYVEAKKRIFEGANVKIVGVDDPYCSDIFAELGDIKISMNSDIGKIDNPNLRGYHNAQNMAAATAVARELGCDDEDIQAALNNFPGLPHRQFLVRKIGHVNYINDSKATNAEAASKALGAFDHIYWIVGGKPKEGGLEGLDEYVANIKHAFLIGEAAAEFPYWFERHSIPFSLSKTLDQATKEAHKIAQEAGLGCVLLSPACASFDQFSSFEERGLVFTDLVKGLKE